MPVTPAEILKEIGQKKFRPVYFVHGDEPFYIDAIADALEKKVLLEAEKSFNQFVLFGKDHDVGSVLNYARKYPFMAERQLVIVKEAQALAGLESKEKNVLLEQYATKPLPSTVLLICHQGNFDERKTLAKSFDRAGALVQSKKMYDNKLPDWVADYCHAKSTKISLKAIQMLVENIGNDLKRLSSEIEKVLINLKPNEEISAATVERFVGISKEYNVFEFQKALMQKDVFKANQIATFFAANPKDNPIMPILVILYGFFSKVLVAHGTSDKSERNLATVLGVNPYFVKDYLQTARNYPVNKVVDIIAALRQADGHAKGIDSGSQNDGDIVRQLVFRILH